MRNWGGRWIGWPGRAPNDPVWDLAQAYLAHIEKVNADWAYGQPELDSWQYQPAPVPKPATLTTDRSVLGEHAKRLLDDPLLTLAFDKLREDLAIAWRNTKADDIQGRERAYFMQWALEGVRGKLQALLNDAKVIEAEQKRKEAQASR